MHTRSFCATLNKHLSQNSGFLQVILGPRQVGKTTGTKGVLKQWSGPTLYCTADLPAPPDNQWLIEQWQKARLLGPNSVLVIDEVQKVERWSEVVKALYDQDREGKKLQVVLLGSASLSLQQGLNESLLGRFELLPVHHWDAYESKAAFGWNLNTFLKYGGYPGPVSLIEDTQRWSSFMRDSVVESIISKDIFALRQINKPALFRQSFELAMAYPAQELSYQKFLGQLQDRGNADTVKSYLSILEKAFILKVLEKYSAKSIKTKSSSPKLIPLAPALINTFRSPEQIDLDPSWRGHVFEAAVIAKVNSLPGKLFYWRQGKYEVDFVWEYEQKLFAVEIKSVNRSRANSGLQKFREHFPKAKTLMLDEELATTFLFSADGLEQLLYFYDNC